MRRCQPATRPGATKHTLMDPKNDGVDYTNAQHARALKLVHQNINRRLPKQRAYLRFRGRPQPKMRSVATKKTLIYKECISERWASLNDENRTLYGAAPPIPSNFMVLNTPVPDELISEADRRWLTVS